MPLRRSYRISAHRARRRAWRRRLLREPIGDPRPVSGASHEITLGDQLRVRLDDDPSRYLELISEQAARRQLGPGAQPTGADRRAQLSLQLSPQRRRSIQCEVDVHWPEIVGRGRRDGTRDPALVLSMLHGLDLPPGPETT